MIVDEIRLGCEVAILDFLRWVPFEFTEAKLPERDCFVAPRRSQLACESRALPKIFRNESIPGISDRREAIVSREGVRSQNGDYLLRGCVPEWVRDGSCRLKIFVNAMAARFRNVNIDAFQISANHGKMDYERRAR
jgi:hypothetical protein